MRSALPSLVLCTLALILCIGGSVHAEPATPISKWEYRLLVYDPFLHQHETDEDAAHSRSERIAQGWVIVPKDQNLATALRLAGDEGWELIVQDFKEHVFRRPKR